LFAQAPAAPGSEKPLLVSTLREIRERASAIAQTDRLRAVAGDISGSAVWLERRVESWSPAIAGEGLPLLASLGRMLHVLRSLPAGGPQSESLLAAVSEDLTIKVEHCRQNNLAAKQRVAVVTKKNGVEEVKGLAVLYIEKFFQHDPGATPKEFLRFSSPAVDDLVPGRYIVWAKQTDGSGRAGPPKEVRIGGGVPKDPIEVLTP
jgi:hypothetical protein